MSKVNFASFAPLTSLPSLPSVMKLLAVSACIGLAPVKAFAEPLSLQLCRGEAPYRVYIEQAQLTISEDQSLLSLNIDGQLRTSRLQENRSLTPLELAKFNKGLASYLSQFGQATQVQLVTTAELEQTWIARVIDKKGRTNVIALQKNGVLLGSTNDCLNPLPPRELQCRVVLYGESASGKLIPFKTSPFNPQDPNYLVMQAHAFDGKAGASMAVQNISRDRPGTQGKLMVTASFKEGSGYIGVLTEMIHFGETITPEVVFRHLNKRNGTMRFSDELKPSLRGEILCD